MNKLQAVLPQMVRIIEVLEIGLGVDLEKDSTDAHYPVKVRLCDAQTDIHTALAAQDKLTKVTTIHIQTWTKSDINAGDVYKTIHHPNKDNVYVKVERVSKKKTRKVA